jgi:hypothetical protein
VRLHEKLKQLNVNARNAQRYRSCAYRHTAANKTPPTGSRIGVSRTRLLAPIAAVIIGQPSARPAPAPRRRDSPWTATNAAPGQTLRLTRQTPTLRATAVGRQPTAAQGNNRRKNGGSARASRACHERCLPTTESKQNGSPNPPTRRVLVCHFELAGRDQDRSRE